MLNNSVANPKQVVVAREGVKLWRQGGPATEPFSADFSSPTRVVLLVHGFTASAENMGELADYLQQPAAGFTVINCTYNCFDGIDRAAETIAARLDQFAEVIGNNRVAIVAHSMGGLVIRSLVSMYGGSRYVRGVITLATPHLGTLKERRFLSLALSLMEFARKTPFTDEYFPDSRSGKQLICTDKEGLVEKLRSAPAVPGVQWISFSGGKRSLEFGSNLFKNALANWYIQKSFDKTDNDGLVEEGSASAVNPALTSCIPGATHIGKGSEGFVEHKNINHTSLVNCGWAKVEVLKHLDAFFA